MKKNILITGGAGFVGSNLAIFLNERLRDQRIICFDNLTRRGSEINAERLKEKGIWFVKGDIRDKRQLFSLPKIDFIVEASAEPSVLAAYKDPLGMIDTNLIGTVNCLELARRDKADFIFLSTSRVYPIAGLNNIPFEELSTRFDFKKDTGFYEGVTKDFPLEGVRSLYGATKLCSEHLVLEFLDMFPMKGVINRLGVIAGPWQMGRVDQGIVGFWVARHMYGKNLDYIGYNGCGKQVRDVLHVDDVCELILYEIQNLDKVTGKVFNAGGGRKNSVSLLELTALTQDITKKRISIGRVAEERKADVRIYITDNSFLSHQAGWRPTKSVENIVSDIHVWIDKNFVQLKNIFE